MGKDARNIIKPAEAAGFRDFIQRDWGPADRTPRLPDGNAKASAAHRSRLSAALPGVRIAVAAGNAPVRSNTTDYGFRPDSDFVWLTGCQAEGAVLVMHPVPGGHDAELFLRPPKGPESPEFYANARDGELWVGPAPGLLDWAAALDLPCRPVDELAGALRGPAAATVGVDPLLDALTSSTYEQALTLRRTLAELKRVKDSWEQAQLRHAVDATVRGFADVVGDLPAAIDGGGERWLESTFHRRSRAEGNGPGYGTIVAAGPHAPVLHWTRCDGPVRPGDVLLMDAGVEADTLYTADVTRTLPISGEFTPAQRQVYDLVHAAHLAAIEEVRPGRPFSSFFHAAMRVLAEGLHDWGMLPVSVEEALSPDGQHHRRYICCGVGHHVGLDVHDCGSLRPAAYQLDALAPGMALTVEPGLYFHPNDLTVPAELRGIGVRIEDDLLVTETGAEILSAALPMSASGIEEWMARI
ncbi:Xaa-Pro aminopeptidase [Actinokineospora alba]|uniref:Xaa-Pro aminopeptidase n=1 Tax=Actinokineospora alba TaxID=504798 RepID=A0A1H0FCI9_9PSEU|nr:aminopeptidase P family protein [Actinokineospora alba]TDP69421.1 Xaa-Pro aminopeptidase [Actinokineospora alba]SDI17144.1 Xaa-Pro aminopeptidase [Actinokineospora alba]SDN92179.1 Xaa-Pro aminopeptidase [Actinokineospora alba]